MRPRWILGAISIAACGGCAHPPAGVELSGVTRIAVLRPLNRTGDELFVTGASALEKYVLKGDRVTVPDILASEARFQLARRGYLVVPPETVEAVIGDQAPASVGDASQLAARHSLDAAVLYIEVRRWEADAPSHPRYILAAVEATLIDPGKDCILWEARRPARPQATPGVVVLGDAQVSAARAVMEELFQSLEKKPGG